MIYVTIKTERVYGHDGDGMPKIETINQTLSEFGFEKFLKLLPHQGYIKDRLKVVKAVHEGTNESADTTVFEERLKKAYTPEVEVVKVDEKTSLVAENLALKERLAAIEAKLGLSDEKPADLEAKDVPVKETKSEKDVNVDEIEDINVLRALFTEKTGKAPHPNMGIAKLKSNLKS